MHACMVIFCGWYSDKKNERMIPIIFALLPAILGSGNESFLSELSLSKYVRSFVDRLQRHRSESRLAFW